MTTFEFDAILTTLLINKLLTIKTDKKNVSFLDPFEFTKSVKQLAHILEFFKSKEKDFRVNLLVSNKFIKTNLENFIRKSNIKNNIDISYNLSEIKSGKFVIVCTDYNKKKLDYTFKRLSQQNKHVFYIITKSNDIYNQKNGSYMLYNDSNDIKKLLYIITLINNF